MTDLLQRAIAEIRKLPRERQDVAAAMLLAFVAQDSGSIGSRPSRSLR